MYFDSHAGCAATGRYSFYTTVFGDLLGTQVFLSLDCLNTTKIDTGGSRSVGCATGTDRLVARDNTAGTLVREIRVCGPLCPS